MQVNRSHRRITQWINTSSIAGIHSVHPLYKEISIFLRRSRCTFQQFLRRNLVELRKSNQIGGVGVAGAVLPFGNGLAADAQRFRHKFLRHLAADAVFLQCLAQGFGDSLLFLPHLLGINMLFECLYDQNMETRKEKNLCWHQG